MPFTRIGKNNFIYCIKILFKNLPLLEKPADMCLYGKAATSSHKSANENGSVESSENMENSNGVIFDPLEILLSDCRSLNYALLILNSPVNFTQHQDVMLRLWTQAQVRITVDGGTDRWLTWMKSTGHDPDTICPPELITGDFDSLSEEALKYFTARKSKIVHTPDQNHTDFTKSLRQLKSYISSHNLKVDSVYVLADTCGRLDQILGNIHTLFLADNILPSCQIFQIASQSISWLLKAGKHTILVPLNLRQSQEWCALVPIGHACVVSTTGLKWNLENRILEFGKLVSTSNTYEGSPLVTIETNEPLLWSMGIETLL